MSATTRPLPQAGGDRGSSSGRSPGAGEVRALLALTAALTVYAARRILY
ncbi:hypothetical protein ACFRCX_18625 [Streptomyces sp. NPDC056652]